MREYSLPDEKQDGSDVWPSPVKPGITQRFFSVNPSKAPQEVRLPPFQCDGYGDACGPLTASIAGPQMLSFHGGTGGMSWELNSSLCR